MAAALMTACSRAPMTRLVNASHGERFAEARLCGFSYAPLPRMQRGGNSPKFSRSRAAAGSVLETMDGREPQAMKARAVSHLIQGRADVAAKELEELAARSPTDAKLWSDLAAARYELARSGDDAHVFASALAAAATAVEADPNLPEARFNYALAAAALDLRSSAAENFRRSAALDPGSGWTKEARQRLARLQLSTIADEWKRARPHLEASDAATVTAIAVRFPQQARTWAEGEYLARWAEACRQQHDADAARWLTLAREVGDALRTHSGEALLHDAVAAIDSATPVRRTQLIAAHLTYRRGRIVYSKRDTAGALPLLGEAEKSFTAGRSPMALVARLYRVNALIDREENTDAAAALEAILQAPVNYAALRAYALFDHSLLLGRADRLFEGLEAARQAEAIFARLRELENDTRALLSMASGYTILGRPDTAWTLHRRAFTAAAETNDVLTLDHVLRAAARDELQDGHPATARALFDIELALPALAPRMRVDALLQRLKANGGRGDVRVIRNAAAAIPDARVREEAMDDIRVAEARRSAPADAVDALTQSIDFRTCIGDGLALAGLYAERARGLRRLGRNDDAAADLASALATLDRQRSTISSEDLRDTFIDTWHQAVEELFDLYTRQGKFGAAFDLIERTRARGLTERFHSGTRELRSLSAAEIAAHVPPRTVVAQFTLRADTVVILAIRRQGLTAHITRLEQFDMKAAALREGVEKSRGQQTLQLDEMRTALIAPLAEELRAADTLVVVPDEHTAGVPFAALRDATTGHYLVEDLSIVMAPSASSYVLAAGAHAPRFRAHALLVGNPTVNSDLLPDLPPLPSAGREVQAIRPLYAGATVLTRNAATRSAVLRQLETSDPVHIAAHAIVNEREPALSLIALASQADDPGVLYLRDIAALRLPQSPLVVLAGCRTASRAAGYGSLRSLAAAFLVAGSRAAIGSLWDVDDETTNAFSTRLHRSLVGGAAPERALRDAQLAMLHSSVPELRDVAAWAGFQIYVAR